MPMPRRMLIAAVSTSRRNRLSPESAMSCSVSPKEMPETLRTPTTRPAARSEEHTSELQSRSDLVCRLLLEKKKKQCVCTDHRKHPQHGQERAGEQERPKKLELQLLGPDGDPGEPPHRDCQQRSRADGEGRV